MVLAKPSRGLTLNRRMLTIQGSFGVFSLFTYLFCHFHDGFTKFTSFFFFFKKKVL